MLIGIKLDLDFEFSLASQDFRLFDGEETYFIEGVWGVADQLSEKDLFLGVERVDDDIHQSRISKCVPADFSLELELLLFREHCKAWHDHQKGHD